MELEPFIKDYNYICLKDGKKYIKEENICIDSCSYQKNYSIEYNNTCVEKCPNGTYLYTERASFSGIKKFCIKNYIYNNENLTDLPEGYYIIDNNLNNIDKCDIKCKHCTKESKQNNSCISCNTNNFYFPKFDDTNNKFVNCYNNNTIGNGYFLADNKYMTCYPTL